MIFLNLSSNIHFYAFYGIINIVRNAKFTNNMKIYKNQDSTIVNVAELLATIISSRDIVEVLGADIKKADTKSVVLDFANVKFISRSAAHSLLLLKDKLKNKFLYKKDVSFVNAKKDVLDMLRIVAANRAYPKNVKPEFNPQKIDINSLLKEATV